jgi:hypothetical protein
MATRKKKNIKNVEDEPFDLTTKFEVDDRLSTIVLSSPPTIHNNQELDKFRKMVAEIEHDIEIDLQIKKFGGELSPFKIKRITEKVIKQHIRESKWV